jgi:hypothetical protein
LAVSLSSAMGDSFELFAPQITIHRRTSQIDMSLTSHSKRSEESFSMLKVGSDSKQISTAIGLLEKSRAAV